MYVNNSFHTTYCTNIHPGQDWETTFASLQEHIFKIKNKIAPKNDFGIGLRLSNQASQELGLGEKLLQFRDWLQENHCYVFTMNGFPYGNFHGEKVKENVHAPDWTTNQRRIYTKRLFDQLAVLLPNGVNGGISTSPVGYKHHYKSAEEKEEALRVGADNMLVIALQLAEIEAVTGKYMHLDIEPEPDGLLENTDDVLHFFKNYLTSSTDIPESLVKRYITLCYDICHYSLAFEEPEYTFAKMTEAKIEVGKIQVSAALKILPLENIDLVWDNLAEFDEPVYLHQVTEQVRDGVKTYRDLSEVLDEKVPFTELRAHFHVPIFLDTFGSLQSTQDHIIKTLQYLKDNKISEHLEVETYTWDVLPLELKRDLSESVIRELQWLLSKLEEV